MRSIAALIVAAIAAAGWLASERALEIERSAPVHHIVVVPTDYQRCETVRPAPPGLRRKIVLHPNNSEIV